MQRLSQPDIVFLDLGCAFGQDIRRLVHDGVPSANCWGVDLRLSFVELGYDLFLDKQTLQTKFLEADVFDESESSALKSLDGKVDILQASAFFHLFDRDYQKKVAHRIVRLLKPQKGVTVFGQHVGNVEAGRYRHRTDVEAYMFRHNAESWQGFWNEVGEETGTKWKAETELRSMRAVPGLRSTTDEKDKSMEEARWMLFSVTRL